MNKIDPVIETFNKLQKKRQDTLERRARDAEYTFCGKCENVLQSIFSWDELKDEEVSEYLTNNERVARNQLREQIRNRLKKEFGE